MKTVIVTAPTSEPVTLSQAKEQLRIEDGFIFDDDFIEESISSARDYCENYCNQFFSEQDIKILYTGQMPSQVTFPYPGLTVTAITYSDQELLPQTLAPSAYTVDEVNQIIYITDPESSINYQIEATTSAPVQIRGVVRAVLLKVTEAYDIRSGIIIGASVANTNAVIDHLYPYRLNLGI